MSSKVRTRTTGKGKAAKHRTRLIVPDSHGEHIDLAARDALLFDCRATNPDEIVLLGDHLDCGGTFSTHQKTYTNEKTESYAADVAACKKFLRLLRAAAPNARILYLEGNHEQHVERWATRNFERREDAELALEHMGPKAVLGLDALEITYFRSSHCYQNLTIPGTIRLGKCFFTHGISHAKHAATTHLNRFGANVVFGHIHRSMGEVERTVTSAAHGAWCPGTLAKLQPLYRHTAPTSWTHGYGLQFTNAGSGKFVHLNIPIMSGESLLTQLTGTLARYDRASKTMRLPSRDRRKVA